MNLIPEPLKQRLLELGAKAHSVDGIENRQIAAKIFMPDTEASWYIFHADMAGGDLTLYGVSDIKDTQPSYFIMSLDDFELMKGPMGCNLKCDEFTMMTFGDIAAQRVGRFGHMIGG